MPAKAGIQTSSRRKPGTSKALDPGFRRGDDFLRESQDWDRALLPEGAVLGYLCEQLLALFREFRDYLEEIVHDSVVRLGEDGGLGILVNGHDKF